MSAKPRGKCPECNRSYALTTAGRIWAHQVYRWGATPVLCPGTGRLPKESKR